MRFSGVGKTTLSFVSDADEVKKIRLNVKKYTNPIKELRVPGIKNGKNIYSIFNKDNYASKKISANGPKGSIVVKAAPGWRIKTVRLEDIKNSRYWSHEFYQSRSCKLGLRSSLKAKGYYKLQIVMQNYKNKGKIYLELYIGSY